MVNLIEIRIFCINILKLTTVEPIIFLIYFGWVFGNTIQSPGLYRKVCQIYYTDVSFVNCSSITNQTIEQSVQQHSAEWAIYNAIAYLTPAIFADTILGKRYWLRDYLCIFSIRCLWWSIWSKVEYNARNCRHCCIGIRLYAHIEQQCQHTILYSADIRCDNRCDWIYCAGAGEWWLLKRCLKRLSV